MKAVLIKWTELDYQDNNDNLHYGLEILDENDFSFDFICIFFVHTYYIVLLKHFYSIILENF